MAELEILSRALNLSTPTFSSKARIECFSTKAVSKDKKLLKALESDLILEISHSTSISPPEARDSLLSSAFGPLDERGSRKTFWLLVALLNVAFPDHDFSKVRPDEFRREAGPWAVLGSLSAALKLPESQRSLAWPASTSVAFPTSSSPFAEPILLPLSAAASLNETNPVLRQVLDPLIDLAECEVYSYTPDADSDPNAADSDDESDSEEDNDAYEGDDDALGFEMELGGGGESSGGSYFGRGVPAYLGAGRNQGGYGTPAKSSFSAFQSPGTPTGSEGGDWAPETSASLLSSSYHFLVNKKMKKIVFIAYVF